MFKRLAILVAVLAVAALPAAADLKTGLVGWWRFADSDGKTVKDLSPRGNNGIIEGGTLRPEKAGQSLELDGLGGHVVVAEKTPFGLTKAVTSALWVKAAVLRTNTTIFGVPMPTPGWTTPVFGMYAANGRIVYGQWGSQGVAKALVETPDPLPLNTWIFLAATADGAVVRLYVNGAPVAEKPHAGALSRAEQPLFIGKGAGYGRPSLNGRVGEVRLYDRALGADEVRALFDETRTAYDLAGPPPKRTFADGTVTVESPGSSPDKGTWRAYPTRVLEKLAGYAPSGGDVKVDAYGGRTDRPREKATGFFRATKIDGRHWLIDPDGYRFFHVGINTVNPPRGVDALFGSAAAWGQATTDTLRSGGFNGVSSGRIPDLRAAKQPLVWVMRRSFLFEFARKKKLTLPASGTVGFINMCMPVFHPDFEPHCEEAARSLADTAGDPLMLGIMTDNEIQCPPNLLDRFLELDAANPDLKPGRDAAAAWLAARKGSADTAGITQRDRYEFIAFAFERYYRIVTKAIRKYDPNHMYLGSRINYRAGQFENPYWWKAVAPYHDAVSVNYYHMWGPDASDLALWEAWGGRPIFFSEWYAKAQDVPGLANAKGAGWLVRTQADRAAFYQHFVMGALECRNVVGVHWFKYMDDPSDSVALDNAGGANKGMFDVKGQPHAPLFDRAKAVNKEAYPLIEFFDKRK